MKLKQLKRFKKRHRQQRLGLFLISQACPKSEGVNYLKQESKRE